MVKLNNSIRKSIIEDLELASYSNHLDISQYMQIGVTHVDISIIDLAKSLFEKQPNTTVSDLIDAGISQKKVDLVLGGIENFKALLGITDYESLTPFRYWITECQEGDKILLPYWLYVEYQHEIRDGFTDRQNICKINEQKPIYIQLDHDISLPAIPLTNKRYAKIPINNTELIGVVALLLSMKGCVLEKINNEKSVITVKDVSADERLVIAVSCWASKAVTASQSDLIICVIDDFLQERRSRRDNVQALRIITLDELF